MAKTSTALMDDAARDIRSAVKSLTAVISLEYASELKDGESSADSAARRNGHIADERDALRILELLNPVVYSIQQRRPR